MQPQHSEKALKKIGVSAGIVTGIMVLFFASMMYKNYLDTKKTRLEIKKLNKEGFQ